MPKASIIVPVYNTEEYLDECIRSIIVQTYRDFEILLINDGSTDKSGDVCDSFAKEYPKLVKVFHQENKGLAAARNAGIMTASGVWIMFVDSDDWVEPVMLEVMLEEAESANCDLCISGYITEYPNRGEYKEFNKLSGYRLEDADKLILFKQGFSTRGVGNYSENIRIGASWAKLYRKNFLVENNVIFRENVSISQDAICNLYAIELSNKTIFTRGAFYHYRVHTAQTTTKYNEKALDSMANFLQEVSAFANCYYSKDEAEQIYNVKAVYMLLLTIRLTYGAINTPYSLGERMSRIKTLLNEVPFSRAIRCVPYQSFTREKQIQLWFLRHMPVPFYYFGMKVIDRLRGRK